MIPSFLLLTPVLHLLDFSQDKFDPFMGKAHFNYLEGHTPKVSIVPVATTGVPPKAPFGTGAAVGPEAGAAVVRSSSYSLESLNSMAPEQQLLSVLKQAVVVPCVPTRSAPSH